MIRSIIFRNLPFFKKYIQTFFYFLIGLGIGFDCSVLPTTLPYLEKKTNNSLIYLIFITRGIGSILSSFFSGFIVKSITTTPITAKLTLGTLFKRKIFIGINEMIIISMFIRMICLLIMPLSKFFWLNLFISGIEGGLSFFLELCVSTALRFLWEESVLVAVIQANYLFWSVSSVLAPLFASYVFSMSGGVIKDPLKFIYWFCLFFDSLIAIPFFLFVSPSARPVIKKKQKKEKIGYELELLEQDFKLFESPPKSIDEIDINITDVNDVKQKKEKIGSELELLEKDFRKFDCPTTIINLDVNNDSQNHKDLSAEKECKKDKFIDLADENVEKEIITLSKVNEIKPLQNLENEFADKDEKFSSKDDDDIEKNTNIEKKSDQKCCKSILKFTLFPILLFILLTGTSFTNISSINIINFVTKHFQNEDKTEDELIIFGSTLCSVFFAGFAASRIFGIFFGKFVGARNLLMIDIIGCLIGSCLFVFVTIFPNKILLFSSVIVSGLSTGTFYPLFHVLSKEKYNINMTPLKTSFVCIVPYISGFTPSLMIFMIKNVGIWSFAIVLGSLSILSLLIYLLSDVVHYFVKRNELVKTTREKIREKKKK